jgi:hypothetical protein
MLLQYEPVKILVQTPTSNFIGSTHTTFPIFQFSHKEHIKWIADIYEIALWLPLLYILVLSFILFLARSCCLLFVCPCRSNSAHRDILSEVSIVLCVDVVSDQPTDRTSSTQSWCDCQSRLAGSQETWVRNGSFTCRKSTTWDRRLYFPSEGSGAPDFYHP